MMHKNTKAFTLIEMLIVIVIIGILAAALVPRLQSVQSRARNVKRKADMSALRNGINLHYIDLGFYPYTPLYLVLSGYMTSLPKDPQASTNEPCRAWFTDFSSLYTASGFYNNSTNCTDTAAPFSCSISRNGYLYTRSSTLHYAVLGIRLEPDGTTNSYGGIGAYTGAQIACNWAETNNGGWNNQFSWNRIMGEMAQGFSSKTGLYLEVFQKGSIVY